MHISDQILPSHKYFYSVRKQSVVLFWFMVCDEISSKKNSSDINNYSNNLSSIKQHFDH